MSFFFFFKDIQHAQGLHLALHSGINPGRDPGIICSTRDPTSIGYMQSKLPTHCTNIPALSVSFIRNPPPSDLSLASSQLHIFLFIFVLAVPGIEPRESTTHTSSLMEAISPGPVLHSNY